MRRGFTLVEAMIAAALLGVAVVMTGNWMRAFTTMALEERWATSVHLKALELTQSYTTTSLDYASWSSEQPATGLLAQGLTYTLTLAPYSGTVPAGTEAVTARITWNPKPAATRTLTVFLVRATP